MEIRLIFEENKSWKKGVFEKHILPKSLIQSLFINIQNDSFFVP